jgi:hypothetical protein
MKTANDLTLVIILVIITVVVSHLVRTGYAALKKRFGKSQPGKASKAQKPWQQLSDPLSPEKIRQPPAIAALFEASNGIAQRFRSSLRAATDNGREFGDAFTSAMRDTSDALQTGDALKEAAQMKYPAETIASFMASKKVPLTEIASFVDDHYDPDFGTMLNILAPLAAGETPEAKAYELFLGVSEVYDLEDEMPDLVTRFQALGCTKRGAIKIIIDHSEDSLGQIFTRLKLYEDAQLAATIIREDASDIDLCDSDNYDELRSGGASFVQMATLLKRAGVKASAIMDAESVFEGISLEDIGVILPTLTEAGFPEHEVITGLLDTESTTDEPPGAILLAAFNAGVPAAVLGDILRERNLDIDELDEEMRDAEAGAETRFRIFQGFFGSLIPDDTRTSTQSV